MSFSTLIFCPFSAFLKCDRENEEHVYADLLDVCSSNDQSSGRLWNILDFFIFVFNPSIFSFLRRRSQTDGVLRHLEYQTHMPLVSRVFCLLCGFVTPKRNTQQSSGTRRISIGVAGGGGGLGAIKDIGYIWRAIHWVQDGCMIVCEQTLLRDIVRNSFSSAPLCFTAHSLVISLLASISTRNGDLRSSSNSQTIVDGFSQVIQLRWGNWNSQKRNPYYLFQIHM